MIVGASPTHVPRFARCRGEGLTNPESLASHKKEPTR